MLKGSIQQEYITFVNIDAHNIRAPKYRKQMLTHLKGEADCNTTILEEFNIPFTSMGVPSRQKINRKHWP